LEDPAVKYALLSFSLLVGLTSSYTAFASADDSPLPEQFAEVVLTVEGMT